jgi:hypothetical protein
MTIAIGAEFEGGAIVCADTKVSASDGATSYGSKTFLGVSATRKMYALANSCEDAYAAKMLGAEISAAISDTDKQSRIEPGIKSVMEAWYNGYRHVQPPQVQFILAFTQEGWKSAALYYCEPPNTVAYGSPIAIGKGSRAVDPALNLLGPTAEEKPDVKATLLRMAYLMYLAKRDEAAACGGETYAIVIAGGGGFTMVDEAEMKQAEETAKKLSNAFNGGIFRLTSSQQRSLDEFYQGINAVLESYKGFEFSSLKFLERKLWDRSPKRPASQKSQRTP